MNRARGLTYSGAGVDIDAGNFLVNAIKPLAASTARTGCTAGLGGFGGFFDLKAAGYSDPLLVSGTDGVGTKLKVRITETFIKRKKKGIIERWLVFKSTNNSPCENLLYSLVHL